MLKERLHIVYLLAASYARGGIKIQIEQANRLADRGHRVEILSTWDPPDWIDVHVPWHRRDRADGLLGSQLPACDVAVFSFYEQAYALLHSCHKAGCAPVYLAQGDEMLFGNPDTEENASQKSNILAARESVRLPYPLLTVSEAAADRIRDLGGRDVTVIPNGIDRTVFHPGATDTGSGKNIRILAVGAEMPAFKGIGELYAALIQLKKLPGTGDFTFVRASPAPNSLEQLPIDVEFHQSPSQQQLARLYAGADLFVGPSHQESFYLPPLEAMSCGTAVVCSDLPAVRQYARPHIDFIPFTPGNVPALYRAVHEAISSAELRRGLAAQGLKVAERLSWTEIIKQIEAFLLQVHARKARIQEALDNELSSPTVRWSIDG